MSIENRFVAGTLKLLASQLLLIGRYIIAVVATNIMVYIRDFTNKFLDIGIPQSRPQKDLP